MQKEFEEDDIPIQIIGINEVGYEIANQTITDTRDAPWLQDIEEINAWELWDVTYRDVYILDQDLKLRGIYNLTSSNHNLNEEQDYLELKEILIGLIEK